MGNSTLQVVFSKQNLKKKTNVQTLSISSCFFKPTVSDKTNIFDLESSFVKYNFSPVLKDFQYINCKMIAKAYEVVKKKLSYDNYG